MANNGYMQPYFNYPQVKNFLENKFFHDVFDISYLTTQFLYCRIQKLSETDPKVCR